MAGYRGLAIKVVQYAVGIVAFAWLVSEVEWDRAVALLGNVSPATGLALVGVTVFGLLARFFTWYALISAFQSVRFVRAASTDLAVNFINQLLPSRVSGRAAAPFVLRTETGLSSPNAVAVAGFHTGLYALLYALVGLVGLGLGISAFSPGLTLVVVLSVGLYAGAGVVILVAGNSRRAMNRLAAMLGGVLGRLPVVGDRLAGITDRLPALTDASADAFRDLSRDPRAILSYAAGWAGSLLLAPGLRVWLLLSALGTGFGSPVLLPVYLVTAYSVTVLPLTPGGIGVTEATTALVFVALGVPQEVIVPVVFVDRFLGVYLPALAGWYPSLRLDVSGLAAE